MFCRLILNLIHFILPLHECLQRLVTHEVLAVYRAMVVVETQLVVNKRVVELDGSSISLGVGIAYTLDARPIKGTKTHGAWLARGIYRATFKVEGL